MSDLIDNKEGDRKREEKREVIGRSTSSGKNIIKTSQFNKISDDHNTL